jgi:hypothetical protein
VLGLLVAIPSMVCYNALVNRIRGMVVRLDNFANELSAGFDRTFVDHRFSNGSPAQHERPRQPVHARLHRHQLLAPAHGDARRPRPRMKRHSNRHQLRLITEISITPLLDLVLVLLFVFLLAAPLAESGQITACLPSAHSAGGHESAGTGGGP